MRTSIKLGLTTLMAATLLASALTTASARNLSFSNQQLRVTWSRLEFRSALVTVRCQVTLEGSFHARTFLKVARTWMGNITRISFKEETCTGGRASPDRAPPWRITYESFAGTLPSITRLHLLLEDFRFLTESAGVMCRYGTATDRLSFSATVNGAREITNLVPIAGRNTVSLQEGEVFCPSRGTVEANAEDGIVTLLNTATRIRVTLI